jgi:hypothetical protein
LLEGIIIISSPPAKAEGRKENRSPILISSLCATTVTEGEVKESFLLLYPKVTLILVL